MAGQGVYVVLARFPKGHAMDRHPGPLLVIPESDWENFVEVTRPAFDTIGTVTNKKAFLDRVEEYYPKVVEKLDDWGASVQIQVWREPVPAYKEVKPQDMKHAS